MRKEPARTRRSVCPTFRATPRRRRGLRRKAHCPPRRATRLERHARWRTEARRYPVRRYHISLREPCEPHRLSRWTWRVLLLYRLCRLQMSPGSRETPTPCSPSGYPPESEIDTYPFSAVTPV